jgi:hypothetical protein
VKKIILYTASIIFVLIVVLLGIKYKQKKDFIKRLKQPKLESLSNIEMFSNKANIPGIGLAAKDSNSLTYIKTYFPEGVIVVFDSNKIAIQSNLSQLNGACYSDMVNSINNGFHFDKKCDSGLIENYNIESLLQNSCYLNPSDSSLLKKSKISYYVVFGWNIYSTPSYDKSLLAFTQKILTAKNIVFINVNSDYNSNWISNSDDVPVFDYH